MSSSDKARAESETALTMGALKTSLALLLHLAVSLAVRHSRLFALYQKELFLILHAVQIIMGDGNFLSSGHTI